MFIEPPKIDFRNAGHILKWLEAMIPHYTPEWKGADEKDAGRTLVRIFSHISDAVIKRMNQMPRKNFVAFLDMLGIKLLPAQSARAPVAFHPAVGAQSGFLISERTQVAAAKTDEHDEIPFETEKNLWAISSKLSKVISLDPAHDAIYFHPPDFLKEELKDRKQLTYQIASPFSLDNAKANPKIIQLDHVTDLKKGDLLKIGDGNTGSKPEYVEISKISGNVVKLEDKLVHSYLVNTPIEKVVKFDLFAGKNTQEHSIYIAHKDLFQVKSKAQFDVVITHLADTEIEITPLTPSWEYWGEVELEGEEEKVEDWHTFVVTGDIRGLKKTETVTLSKPTAGEIKEKEIHGIKNRWIRCKVQVPLPPQIPRKLPILDNIKFKVRSSGDDILPELAFNNNIPLEIGKPFTPFGNEPRMFDNFYFSNKEVFSSKGAKIIIDCVLEERGIVGAPTAITYTYNDNANDGESPKEVTKVFARGTYGRLMELELELLEDGTTKETWNDHSFPEDTKLADTATPQAKKYGKKISVFAIAENGHLVERFYNGEQWQPWLDHDVPEEGVKAVYDPAVTDYGDSDNDPFSVFVVVDNGSMYEFSRTKDKTEGMWIARDKPDKRITSAPYAVSYLKTNTRSVYDNAAMGGRKESSGPDTGTSDPNSSGDENIRAKVFVQGEDGRLYELDCRLGDESDRLWRTDYLLPAADEKVDSRPFANIHENKAIVFIKSDKGFLWEFDTQRNSWDKKKFPKEMIMIKVSSDPHGIINFDNHSSPYIFVRGSDDALLEWNGSKWETHQTPAGSKLKYAPFALRADKIYSASSSYSMIERVGGRRKVWNEYKDPYETALAPKLSWEYWNKDGWLAVKDIDDKTSNLMKTGLISFDLPGDIGEVEIVGQKSYWLRARIVGGDFGKEDFALSIKNDTEGNPIESKLISTKNRIRPPRVTSLKMDYELETEILPEKCLAYNNCEFLDHTDACKEEGKHFIPFVELEEKNRSLYLGFEKPFQGGPVRIFFHAKELRFREDNKPEMKWYYSVRNDWRILNCLDATEGLIKADMLELIGPWDFTTLSKFGEKDLSWIKGSLAGGEYEENPLLEGIYPNTTWVLQAESIKNELLGSSDGKPDQTFQFFRYPVLEGEEIRVRESLTEEEKEKIIEQEGDKAIHDVKDDRGKIIETWVVWKEVEDFYDSTPESRHYTIDRASGVIRFGNGTEGMIPPRGENNSKAFFYQTGGGVKGNIEAGGITTLKSAAAGVEKVLNYTGADGGSDTTTLDQMLEFGPAIISHRKRAVTVDDFEWLARQATRKVAKVKCLPNMNKDRRREAGWVSLIIVPDSPAAEPFPSLMLRREVQRYLQEHAANTLISPEHISVDGPHYVKVGVSVDLYVTSLDFASIAEHEVRRRLDRFFHPLTGGTEGKGWEFGRDVTVSDVYVLLEEVEGIDYVENVTFQYDGKSDENMVEIKGDFLVSNGEHTINVFLSPKA